MTIHIKRRIRLVPGLYRFYYHKVQHRGLFGSSRKNRVAPSMVWFNPYHTRATKATHRQSLQPRSLAHQQGFSASFVAAIPLAPPAGFKRLCLLPPKSRWIFKGIVPCCSRPPSNPEDLQCPGNETPKDLTSLYAQVCPTFFSFPPSYLHDPLAFFEGEEYRQGHLAGKRALFMAVPNLRVSGSSKVVYRLDALAAVQHKHCCSRACDGPAIALVLRLYVVHTV